ncbi:MAG TPA: PQQ-dependent sugar dehydrogenase [Rubrobacter sp.]|nr:PQQ-dependent sugar dehydrogenase [Rubrobacter sp.]
MISALILLRVSPGLAQAAGPTMLVDDLGVRTAVSGLNQPTSMSFIGPDDLLVLEKNSGKVMRVQLQRGDAGQVVGQTVTTVLDLDVNSTGERGLLGIALHPDFPVNPGVYLYWTCRSTLPLDANPLQPEEQRCSDSTRSGINGDVLGGGAQRFDAMLRVPLLGNQVDRFEWDGTNLDFDKNVVRLRGFLNDSTQPRPASAHAGGVIRFGPDGKLYVVIGDSVRRGQMQNLPDGWMPSGPDDQFGGPEPDDAHLTGVILRLNDDGTTPVDNPFYSVGSDIGGEVGNNIQKVYAYGIRNSFGMAFDPVSGNLWDQENGDDAFDELNLVRPGTNSGWIQIMGPVSRIQEFKEIEVNGAEPNPTPNFLQALRWPPTNIADSPEEALSRLFELSDSTYSDPELSWKYGVAPGGIGFVTGAGLGPQYQGDLFVAAAGDNLEEGYLFHFNLTGNRRAIGVDDPRLEDRVADNAFKGDITESESMLIGRDFGAGTDIQMGPDGNLYVVSYSDGAVYEIYRVSD